MTERGQNCVVEVKCPHKIGLCYAIDYGPPLGVMLANLPCPCNELSEVIRQFVEVPADPDAIERYLNGA